MERKSGSSSRSPSLSRRPSLKDKKPTVISKPKKKPTPGVKKERWLLTRKTWRYMSDAVGNLLPTEYRGGSSRRGSNFPASEFSGSQRDSSYTSGPQQSSSLRSSTYTAPQPSGPGRGPSFPEASSSPEQLGDLPTPATSPTRTHAPLEQHQVNLQQQQYVQQDTELHRLKFNQQQQLTQQPLSQIQQQQLHQQPLSQIQQQQHLLYQQQQQQQQQQQLNQQRPLQPQTQQKYSKYNPMQPQQTQEPYSSANNPANPVPYQQSQGSFRLGKVRPGPATSSAYSWSSFPSHRPGVTPTGPGPGGVNSSTTSSSSSQFVSQGGGGPSSDPRDITAIEKHFRDVCNKEKKYLLWTKTKAKGLSGPSLRQFKLKQQEAEGEERTPLQGPLGHDPRLASIDKHDFYSDYYSPEEEEFGDEDDYDEYEHEDQVTVRERRRSSTASQTIRGAQSCFRPLSTISSSGSETTFVMIVTGNGVQKILRNTGIQTDPFPEEILTQLRLQASHEDREKKKEGENETDEKRETVIPITSPGGVDRSKDSSESGRDSSELLDGNKGALECVGSNKGADTSIATDQTDKKSEESGYASSISDTVMKYLSNLRMVRKNSKADTKETIDKFKTVNYDRSLRYIKSKNVTVEEALEYESNKALGLNQPTTATATLPAAPAPPPTRDAPRKTGVAAKGSKKAQGAAAPGNPSTPRTFGSGKKKSSQAAPGTPHSGPKGSVKSERAAKSPLSPKSDCATKVSETSGTSEKPLLPIEDEISKGPESEGGVASVASHDDSLSSIGTVTSITPGSPVGTISKVDPGTPAGPMSTVGTVAPVPATSTVAPVGAAPQLSASPPVGVTPQSSTSPPVGVTPRLSSSPPVGAAVQITAIASPAPVTSAGAGSPTSSTVPAALLGAGGHGAPGILGHLGTAGPVGQVASICPSVGIQAGESLIRFLKNFNPRKFSDFSSTTSYCSSESPVEVTSPRYSIATTLMSSASEGDTYFHHAAALATLMATGKYFKSTGGESGFPSTTTRSSIDMFSVADSSEYDDVFNNYQILQSSSSQVTQQQQQYFIQEQSTGSFSSSEPTPSIAINKKAGSRDDAEAILNSSPSASSIPGLSTYSYSQRLTQIPSTYSSRQSQHQPHLELNTTSPKMSSSTPNTPIASCSTSLSGSGLMKSFFSSSPFASTFGSKVGFGFKKPTSTTSLVTQSLSTPSPSLLTSVPPPTTSSSPNLLSLIHSSASSLVGGGSRSTSRGDPPLTSIPSGPSSSLVSSIDHVISKYHTPLRPFSSTGVSFKGSLVTQKGQMTLPVGSGEGPYRPSSLVQCSPTSSWDSGASVCHNPMGSSPSTVMQKSKSSSSVLPLYGSGEGKSGSGETAVTPSSATKLISKSRIFKSRSKSSTRGTGSTGSTTTATCTWAPQGKCKWKSRGGKIITLEPTTVLNLSDVERQTLQEVALEKLKTLSLGVDIKIPKDKAGGGQPKPKRRPYLLKKKALSTGFFESGTKRDEGKETGGSGVVFGVSLSQCVTNDRLKAEAEFKTSQNGSRNSLSSLYETQKEEKGSTESLFRGKRKSIVPVEAIADILTVNLEPPPMAVPTIVTACVRHLENYGLHTTGIFRVSTSLKRIRQLREEIDGGKEIRFGEEHSPHDVAALLKEFLRDLPEPLLSRELYQAFLKTQRIRNRKQQLEATQHLVQLLPVPNRDTLASLLKFFAKVVANASETRSSTGELLAGNKMEGYSLATLIAPNILPCMPTEGHLTSIDLNLTKERRDSIDVVNYMISNYQQLFEVTPDLLHDVYLHLMDTHPEAVEDILKLKCGVADDGMEEEVETSSVFEGSECGEAVDVEEARVFRRREDILHEGAAKSSTQGTRNEGRRERFGVGGRERVSKERGMTSELERPQSGGRERGSKDRGGSSDIDRSQSGGRERVSKDRSGLSDAEKAQSGGESDTSSTKSASRWFRRTRADSKSRTSSDSGTDKLKGSKSRETGLHESMRASSLDSVNVGHEVVVRVDSKDDRPKTSSEQSLKVPDNYNRRQSSPVLESSGIITASLKIPVPVPLNIDDTDIPFIEDDHHEGPHLHSFHQSIVQSKPRGRSASTDSSALARTPSSSITNTPISSPVRQPSSEASSPVEFSPPGSPPFDPRTFPYEEMTARILIGAPSPGSSSASPQSHVHSSIPLSNLSTVTTSVSTSESKSAGSTPTVRPKINNKGAMGVSRSKVVTSLYVQPVASSGGGASAPVSPQPSSSYVPISTGDVKGIGRETKAANIGGLIKSKTADFEKLVKSSTPSTTSSTSTYSIAPKMRLRSQENIVLKQQFLLRQQQQHADEDLNRSHSEKETKPLKTKEEGEGVRGHRTLTRRRHIMGSVSSSAIVVGSGDGSSPPSQPVPITGSRPRSREEGHDQAHSTPSSRWKRSEIIASRQERHASGDPETFV